VRGQTGDEPDDQGNRQELKPDPKRGGALHFLQLQRVEEECRDKDRGLPSSASIPTTSGRFRQIRGSSSGGQPADGARTSAAANAASSGQRRGTHGRPAICWPSRAPALPPGS
jgi:hypothetical protein